MAERELQDINSSGELTEIKLGGTSAGKKLLTSDEIETKITDKNYVPATRTVNDKPLSTNIEITKADLGLGNVDNTTDLGKPISTQTQDALNERVDKNAPIVGATKTKITYDIKGLVTNGDDATTNDIADYTNKRYMTDAEKSKLSGLSNQVGDGVTVLGAGTLADPFVSVPGASGVYGPASSVDERIVLFNGVDGKLIKDSGKLISDLQPAGSYELTTNKENTTLDTSTTKYPTNRLVKEYADALVVGLLDYRGAFDASVSAYPITGGSGTAGAILKGDMWIISVGGTMGTAVVQVGDSVIANVDTPGQTDAKWNVLNSNISYVPEDSANKVTSLSAGSTDVQYPSAKLVYDQLAGKISTYGPQTAKYVLAAPNATDGIPSFRALVASDLPTPDLSSRLALDQTTPQTIINGQPIQDTLTASELVSTDANKKLQSLPVATYPSLTELSYVKGVTSGIQGQLNSKGAGTVTSVAALTLGTTGTDVSSTVATGTTTPVITLNIPTASAANRGALSSTDWSTFNGKGAGDMVLASVQSVTGLKTFDKDKVAIKGTSTGKTVISTANTSATDYTATLQAKDGTLAYLSDTKSEVLGIAISDEATALTTGLKATFRMPFAFTLNAGNAGLRLGVTTAPTGATIIVDVKESGTTILSTKLSINTTEKTSVTASSQVVISDTSLADDAEITIHIDQVGSTIAGAGAKIYLIGNRP